MAAFATLRWETRACHVTTQDKLWLWLLEQSFTSTVEIASFLPERNICINLSFPLDFSVIQFPWDCVLHAEKKVESEESVLACSSITDLYRHTICMQMIPPSALNRAVDGVFRAICHSVHLIRLSHSMACPALSHPPVSFHRELCCSCDYNEWSSGNCEQLNYTFILIQTHSPQAHIIRAEDKNRLKKQTAWCNQPSAECAAGVSAKQRCYIGVNIFLLV